jgi:2'-5' RNA ligase
MQEKLLKQYANLEQLFKTMEQERKELRQQILAELQKHKLDKVESDFGIFTVSSRPVWAYTKAVDALSAKLALAKAKEQKSGKAKVESETKFIVFTPNKE